MKTRNRRVRRARRLKQSKRLRIPNNRVERLLFADGRSLIAGIDEVGRGAWAGPVVAAAVILSSHRLNKLRDSKLLTRKEREILAAKIRRAAVAWSVAVVNLPELDELGIGQASFLAMRQAIVGLKKSPDYLLVDGFKIPQIDIPQQAIIKGDQKISSIAAASILAKVERDRIMRTLHRSEKECRKYRFDLNKGYPSPLHKRMLAKYGPCRWHRYSFTPIRQPKLLSPVDMRN